MRSRKPPPWLRGTVNAKKPAVSVGWYDEEQWALVKANSTDPDRFEDTFEQWTQMAEAALAGMRSQGLHAEKYYVQASALLAWCIAHGKPNNAGTRAQFVSAMQSAEPRPSAA